MTWNKNPIKNSLKNWSEIGDLRNQIWNLMIRSGNDQFFDSTSFNFAYVQLAACIDSSCQSDFSMSEITKRLKLSQVTTATYEA